MTQSHKAPELVLGTMTFGVQTDEMAACRIVERFLEQGFREIDTAHFYGDGKTEEILGRMITPALRKQIFLATKANPWGEDGLQPQAVRRQLETSLKRLQTDSVDLFYLHAPDRNTPIEITLEACQELFSEGRFRELGLSNYASWQVIDIWHICKKNGWVLPTAYQGMYNGITRTVEAELFPALRSAGIRFYAYNPLAGGLLTGKYADLRNIPQTGRFAVLAMYQDRYWKQAYFDAVDSIRELCAGQGIKLPDSALRWELFHSMLSRQQRDTLIIGASNLQQLKDNLAGVQQGPLPAEIVDAYEHAWRLARPDCPDYFRN
ncbi:MAG: aldo/keto reductase [Pelovirga sp.]